MTYGGFKFQKALGVMSCKGEAKQQLKLKESVLRLHAQAIANMVASTLRKTTIMEEQIVMDNNIFNLGGSLAIISKRQPLLQM
jgi:hypothetical protein